MATEQQQELKAELVVPLELPTAEDRQPDRKPAEQLEKAMHPWRQKRTKKQKQSKARLARHQADDFYLGDRVVYKRKRKKDQVGKVVKVNPKTAEVEWIDGSGSERCNFEFLTL